MWLCVCGHPRLCFLWCLVLFLGFELKFLRRKFLNLDKKLIWLKRMWFLKTFGIIDMHFIEWNLVLKSVSTENFSFSKKKKKFLSFQVSIGRTCFLTDWKSAVFRPKLIAWFDSFFDSSWSFEPVSKAFSILGSIPPDRYKSFLFKNKKESKHCSSKFCLLLQSLSIPS